MSNEERIDQSERAPRIDPFARQETREEDRTRHATGDLGGGSRSFPEGSERPRTDDASESSRSYSGGTERPTAAESGGGTVGTADLARPSSPAATREGSEAPAPLLAAEDSSRFEDRWRECQQSFVDEPRSAVKHADELVAEMMQKVASQFASTRDSLEKQWARGDEVSTEELRLALQQYRAFFKRLLAV
jgi:hypothetical protein